MPTRASFELETDAKRGLVKVTLKGPVGTDEFLAGFGRLLAHPDFHPGMRILVDMLDHVHQIGSDGIDQIARAFINSGEAFRGSVVAVVVARVVSYGMLRMLQIKVSEVPFTFFVFYDLQEAEKALHLT
jgi:hypothetical protein